MPDQILKRTVRGMLPYQKNSSGRNALRSLRVEIGTPSDLSETCPMAVNGEIQQRLTVRYLSDLSDWAKSARSSASKYDGRLSKYGKEEPEQSGQHIW